MSWTSIPREAVQNGLLAMYDLQTPVERAMNRTIEKNRKGFDAIDAPVMSRYAKELLTRGKLSEPSLEYVKKRLWKYRNQLLAMGIVSQDMIVMPKQLSLGI